MQELKGFLLIEYLKLRYNSFLFFGFFSKVKELYKRVLELRKAKWISESLSRDVQKQMQQNHHHHQRQQQQQLHQSQMQQHQASDAHPMSS